MEVTAALLPIPWLITGHVLLAVVLLAAVFTMVVFLLVDLAYFVIDPRIK